MRIRPGPGDHALVGHAPEAAPQVDEQPVLQLVDRREIGVPGLRGMRHVAAALPREPSHAEPGAGADDEPRAVLARGGPPAA